MSRIRRAAALLFLAAALVFTAGCGGSNLSVQDEKVTIKVIVKKYDADFWKVVQMGAEAASREFNVTVDFIGPKDEKDIDGQIKMVNDAIKNKADAIVLAASDYTRLVDVYEKAVTAKIPVVIIDSDVKSDRMKSFIGTDNVDAGRKLGETLVQKLGPDCKIAIMGFVKGAATSDQREEGLLDIVRQHPGIKVLATEYCNSDETVAQVITDSIIQRFPDIDAIVCLNAYGTVGAGQGVLEMKKAGIVKIIGFDSTPTEISYLEKGLVQALVIQNPYSMGYLGVKYALDAIKGKAVPKSYNTGSNIIDKDNMYLPENQKLLFPFTN